MKNSIEKIKRAFGGCEKCYGKGYSTERVGKTICYPDFLSDKEVVIAYEGINYHPCSCSRGKQIKVLMGEVEERERQRLLKEIERLVWGMVGGRKVIELEIIRKLLQNE